MERVVVTGGAGSVGSTLVKRLLEDGNIVCAYDCNEEGLFLLDKTIKSDLRPNLRCFLGDIRDPSRLDLAFKNASTIYHCAAYKHVKLCEYNAFEAVKTNINGTQNVIDAALRASARNVLLTSSDKAVNPTSAMGSTKLVAEKLFTAAAGWSGNSGTKFVVVRFGNVWDSSGSVGQIWKQQLQSNTPITLTDFDMTRFFITMNQAVDLCIWASQNGSSGEIVIGNMGSISLGELAKSILDNVPTAQINLIGLYPGEKLYEELCSLGELSIARKCDAFIVINSPHCINTCNQDMLSIELRSDHPNLQDKVLHNLILSDILDSVAN